MEDNKERTEQTEPKDEDVEAHRQAQRVVHATDEGEESEGEDFEAHRLQHARLQHAAGDEGGSEAQRTRGES